MANKHMLKAINAVRDQQRAMAAKCFMYWVALALREEGYGKSRIKRVLENVHKYAATMNGKSSLEEQERHIANVCGIKIEWSTDNTLTVEEIEEIERYYDGEE